MTLQLALSALVEGDDDQALVHALAAWQSCRHPRIAEVIEKISARATRERLPPKSKGTTQVKQNAWVAYANDRNPSDVENLMSTFANVKDPELLVARLALLEGRCDPRIAKAMFAVLEDPPIKTVAGMEVLAAAIELIVAIADSRSSEAWSRLIRRIGDRGGSAAIAAVRPRMPSASTRLHQAIEDAAKELTDDDVARLEAIEHALTPLRVAEAEALFAAVYAEPDDDQHRVVLADLLQEIGDPRGELIALQLGGKRTPREKHLLGAHAAIWLGSIAPLIDKTDFAFARGFLDRCRVISDRKLEHLVTAPEWRTISELDVSAWRTDLKPLIANMPSLRTLRGVGLPGELPPHDRIERVETGVVSQLDELMPLLAMPALRVLHVDGCYQPWEMFEPFWRAIRSRLTEFSIDRPHMWLVPLLALGLPRLVVHHSRWHLSFEGDLVSVRGDKHYSTTASLISLLEEIPDQHRWRAVLYEAPYDHVLRRAFSGFASLELVSPLDPPPLPYDG